MDGDGYPDDDDLKQVAEWSYDDRIGLMNFLESIWWMADWGWHMSAEIENGVTTRVYDISTAGWSGNESLIAAMRENHMFWAMCWQQHRRGGHFIFRVKEPA